MSSVVYKTSTSAPTALAVATARTALMVITPAQFGGQLEKLRISFDGITASAAPVFYEIVRSTNATNSTPGTNNTNETANIRQPRGRTITTGFTAFSSSTAGNEPTVLTSMDEGLLTPTGGSLVYDLAEGDEIEWDASAGLGVRLTAPAVVNARAVMWFSRI